MSQVKLQTESKDTQTLSSHITETLCQAIVSGDIAPGSKLSEPKLAERFNVSRGPLREAIRRLEVMNLVNHIPHEGVRVVTLDLAQVIEIYEVREALEGKAAALATRHMTPDEISELHRLLELHERHIQSNDGEYMQLEGDFDFHYRIIHGSRNKLLIHQLCEELYHLIRMFRYQASQVASRSNFALTEHKQLVYAIEQKDEQLAEMIMRRHIVRARNNIKIQMKNQETADATNSRN